MGSLDIAGLDDDVLGRLRLRAARNGRTAEEEARAILTAAVSGEGSRRGLVGTLRDRVIAEGGVEPASPPRPGRHRRAPVFD